MWLVDTLVAARRLLAAAYGILFPEQEWNPSPPVLGARSLSRWTTREVPAQELSAPDLHAAMSCLSSGLGPAPEKPSSVSLPHFPLLFCPTFVLSLLLENLIC